MVEWLFIFLDFIKLYGALARSWVKSCSLFFQERRAKDRLQKKKITHDFLQHSSAETDHLLRRLWLRSQSGAGTG